jgi:hypothetical protein
MRLDYTVPRQDFGVSLFLLYRLNWPTSQYANTMPQTMKMM